MGVTFDVDMEKLAEAFADAVFGVPFGLHLGDLEAQDGERRTGSGEAQIVPEAARVQVLHTQRDPQFDGEENRCAGQPCRLGRLLRSQLEGLRHQRACQV